MVAKEEKASSRHRGFTRDFLAGVDPTGSKTFQYGMEDVDKPSSEVNLRRTVGVAGGLIGGGIGVPMAIYGIIGAARGLSTGGVKGVAKGLAKGLKFPVLSPIQASKARRVLTKLQVPGAVASVEDASKIFRLFEDSVIGSRATSVLKKYPYETAAMLSGMPIEAKNELLKAVSGELATGLSSLGLAAIIGGGSAYLQYGKGQDTVKAFKEKKASLPKGLMDNPHVQKMLTDRGISVPELQQAMRDAPTKITEELQHARRVVEEATRRGLATPPPVYSPPSAIKVPWRRALAVGAGLALAAPVAYMGWKDLQDKHKNKSAAAFWDELDKLGFIDPGRVAFTIGRMLQAQRYQRDREKKYRP